MPTARGYLFSKNGLFYKKVSKVPAAGGERHPRLYGEVGAVTLARSA